MIKQNGSILSGSSLPCIANRLKWKVNFRLTIYTISINLTRKALDQVLVAHTCKPSYSGSRDKGDHSLRLTWVKVRPYLPTYQKSWQNGSSGRVPA
jgi:hypothetical protein